MPTNLVEGLDEEMQRCRELRDTYQNLGVRGTFGAAVITNSLNAATRAQKKGNVVAMLRAYEALKNHE